jgi:inner membrane protein
MEQEVNKLQTTWEKSKMLIKGFLIGFLILVMLIPVAMLSELVAEREQRQNEVIKEVSSKWATQQTVAGPLIMVPYLVKTDSTKAPIRRNAYILPDQLKINGKMLPEVRHRSIYDVTLYRSALQFSGSFDPSVIQKLGIPVENILWNECQVMLGLDDARGLEEEVAMQWQNNRLLLEAGLPDNIALKTGLSGKIQLDSTRPMAFNLNLKLKGSSYLYFVPLGKTTEVTLTSPWKDPAFDGNYLPSQPARISDSGFTAKWNILQVSRNYPQVWKDAANYDLNASAFGVKLLQPTDGYAKTQRSVKYALLIIALTFTIFFLVEILQKKQVHPLQYILVGVALCVFYSLLLSISEYVGFNTAYAISATATVALISLYVLGIFKEMKIAAGFGAALGALYTYLFVLIQLQDYSLLFGSIGLFVIVAIIMFYSRKINWYGASYLPGVVNDKS